MTGAREDKLEHVKSQIPRHGGAGSVRGEGSYYLMLSILILRKMADGTRKRDRGAMRCYLFTTISRKGAKTS